MDSDMSAGVAVVALIIYFVVLGVPIMQILNKAGYSRAWILILFIPIVNLIMLWVFAFSRWPSVEAAQQQAYYGGQQPYPYQGQQYPPQGQYPGQQQYPQGAYGNYPQQPPAPPPPGRPR